MSSTAPLPPSVEEGADTPKKRGGGRPLSKIHDHFQSIPGDLSRVACRHCGASVALRKRAKDLHSRQCERFPVDARAPPESFTFYEYRPKRPLDGAAGESAGVKAKVPRLAVPANPREASVEDALQVLQNASDPELRDAVASQYATMVMWRRSVHRAPELAYEEHRTAALIKDQLKNLGLPVVDRVGGTGVIATLQGTRGAGPCIALRADMDALPIQELTRRDYQSETPGVMHACGHDGHVSMLLGAARVLCAKRDQLCGSVLFVFQPAEEGKGGAKKVIESGLLKDVQSIFGIHLWNPMAVGFVGVQEGAVMAASDRFEVTVVGKGGHASMPHQTKDPIVCAANFVSAAQTMVSRAVNPMENAVVSFGTIEGGSAPNVIADRCCLTGTVRTFSEATRDTIQRALTDMAAGIGRAHGCHLQLSYSTGYPATVNDGAMSEVARHAVRQTLGERGVVPPYLSCGAEDFSFYGQIMPACFVFVGSSPVSAPEGQPYVRENEIVAQHSAFFDFDEKAMAVGCYLHCQVALQLLGSVSSDVSIIPPPPPPQGPIAGSV